MELVGTPSDENAEVLELGRTDVTTLFVSMSARHTDGADAEYLEWHSLDHRPEQYRLPALRGSMRMVSTPECRAARVGSGADLDAVDHIVCYLFTDPDGLHAFKHLGAALRRAGRMPIELPAVERAVYGIDARVAAPRARVGSDVLPWFPAVGTYVLIEPGESSIPEVMDVAGVAGAWSGASIDSPTTTATGDRITILFLDDDPVTVAGRLTPRLEQRWADGSAAGSADGPALPRLAAPFYSLVPYDWDRYLP